MNALTGAAALAVLTGCTTLQPVAPYAGPARVVYCASSSEARQALREQFGLPHVIWCLSDHTRDEVEAAADELGIEPPVADDDAENDDTNIEADTDDDADH